MDNDHSKSINELGENEAKDAQYSCKVCKREVSTELAKKEEWYYYIKLTSELNNIQNSEMKHFEPQNVDYVCHEHYQTLPANESQKYVEFGYPYFTSILFNSNGPLASNNSIKIF